MEKRGVLTKTLALVGTVFAWLPVLAPVLFALLRLVSGRRFLFDYLMPAEFFPLALLGGGLLVWAALRARARLPIIAWGLGLAAALLVGGQALAGLTGLATGETKPVGLAWALVLASLAAYTLAVAAVGVGGLLLLRDLYKKELAAV